ncbi:MAG: hypothetical protein IT366_24420 [Candidatus Hydrogenedentes bacterium]|nr:hypothetical protein [Candidatus Hydrogenedentota bacterium]
MNRDAMRELSVRKCIDFERIKQDSNWGQQNHNDLGWLAILTEEVGEAAQCVCKTALRPIDPEADAYYELLEYEIVQIAAVAIAWIECIRRRDSQSVPSAPSVDERN